MKPTGAEPLHEGSGFNEEIIASDIKLEPRPALRDTSAFESELYMGSSCIDFKIKQEPCDSEMFRTEYFAGNVAVSRDSFVKVEATSPIHFSSAFEVDLDLCDEQKTTNSKCK